MSPVDRWRSLGPTLMTSCNGATGRFADLAIHPTNPKVIYGCARAAGIWKTMNGGATWACMTNTLDSPWFSAIAIHPTSPETIYGLVGKRVPTAQRGIYRSPDGGLTWTHLPASSGIDPWGHERLAIAIYGGTTRLYCRSGSQGIWASPDDGATWNLVLAGAGGSFVTVDPANPNTVYAGVRGGPQGGIHRTTNGGATAADWAPVGGGLPAIGSDWGQADLHLCSAKPQHGYCAVWMDGGQPAFRIFVTSDGGTSWSQVLSRDAKWRERLAFLGYLRTSPSNEQLLYVAGVQFLRWDRAAEIEPQTVHADAGGPHVDHHGFAQHPTDPTCIFTGCDGGIYRSSDQGKSGTWTFIGDGLSTAELYDLAMPTGDDDLVRVGTQDNCALVRTGATSEWLVQHEHAGDVALVAVDHKDDKIVYTVGNGHGNGVVMRGFYWSNDAGKDYHYAGVGLPEESASRPAGYEGPGPKPYDIHADPAHEGQVIWAGGELYRGNLTGSTFTWAEELSIPGEHVTRWARGGGHQYVGTNLGRIYVKRDGAPWHTSTPLFAYPSSRRVIDLQVDRYDTHHLYILFDHFSPDSVVHVRHSHEVALLAGEATHIGSGPAWADREPHCLAIDPFRPNCVYVGTSTTVLRGTQGIGGTWAWVAYDDHLPVMEVRALEVHGRSGVMRLASFGRGAWEVDTAPPMGSVVSAEGRISHLRAHKRGTGYGGADHRLEAEVVFGLVGLAGRVFGFPLRADADLPANGAMWKILHRAFAADRRVHVEYLRHDLFHNTALRVWPVP